MDDHQITLAFRLAITLAFRLAITLAITLAFRLAIRLAIRLTFGITDANPAAISYTECKCRPSAVGKWIFRSG